MKIEKLANTTGNDFQFLATLEHFSDKAILDATAEAVREIAKQYVEANMDKITAKLDMTGLANMIAIYAANKLAKDSTATAPERQR